MTSLVTVGPPPQSVTNVRPLFAFLFQLELVASTGRVVQGHDRQPVPVQPSVTVQVSEVVHPP
eukprot:scaffold63831_cov41-Phaeocystis_antarctica.AAC.1